eukprot:766114-Hanusia_phi.AAC.13
MPLTARRYQHRRLALRAALRHVQVQCHLLRLAPDLLPALLLRQVVPRFILWPLLLLLLLFVLPLVVRVAVLVRDPLDDELHGLDAHEVGTGHEHGDARVGHLLVQHDALLVG